MRAVHIYDFDGTLFRTPQRPNWYDNNLDGVWHQNPLSFAEPCLPKGERWVKSIVSEAKRSIASKDVYTIVLTGRKTPFQRVVEDLLSSKGLKFDEVILKDRGDTESFKNRVIDRLMAQFPGAEIHIWEDRHNHLKVFMDHIEMRGGVGIPHAVTQNYSVAECSEEEFRNMRRSASEIIKNLEMRIARLEKSAYTSWEETATQELIEELRLDPNEVSYEIDFIKHDAQVLSVKTRWDEYILFQFKDEYDNFMERELMERVENMSYTTLTKILAKSRQPLINFAPKDVYLEVEDTDFLKDLPQYRNILKKVEDESMQSELIFELCEKLNRNPLLVTKSEKVIKRLYEYLNIDTMEMVEEFGITPEHYEEVGSLRESYALRVI